MKRTEFSNSQTVDAILEFFEKNNSNSEICVETTKRDQKYFIL